MCYAMQRREKRKTVKTVHGQTRIKVNDVKVSRLFHVIQLFLINQWWCNVNITVTGYRYRSWEKTSGMVGLSRYSQMYWNLIWKSPGFVPFGANLTHFGAKPTIPGKHAVGIRNARETGRGKRCYARSSQGIHIKYKAANHDLWVQFKIYWWGGYTH